jgi:hypothetical protein
MPALVPKALCTLRPNATRAAALRSPSTPLTIPHDQLHLSHPSVSRLLTKQLYIPHAPHPPDKRTAQPTQHQRSRESPRNAPWERDMIIVRRQKLVNVAPRYAMCQDVVYGLDIERFLDFCVRRNEKVYQNESRYEEEERPCGERHEFDIVESFRSSTKGE